MAASEDAGNCIPASQRPDGTWRKARQVKEGYVPPDEVEKYESKGKQWISNMPILPPGASEDSEQKAVKMSKNRKKNERRKQQRKEKKDGNIDITGNDGVEEVRATLSGTSVLSKDEELEKTDMVTKNKKIKNLKKKLRQIEELQEKIDNGEVNELTKEQTEKLQRKSELKKELEALEMS